MNFETFKAATTHAWNVHEGKIFLATLYQILLVILQCSVSTCSMLGGTPLTVRMQNIYHDDVTDCQWNGHTESKRRVINRSCELFTYA